jgi:hypothetical protein
MLLPILFGMRIDDSRTEHFFHSSRASAALRKKNVHQLSIKLLPHPS